MLESKRVKEACIEIECCSKHHRVKHHNSYHTKGSWEELQAMGQYIGKVTYREAPCNECLGITYHMMNFEFSY